MHGGLVLAGLFRPGFEEAEKHGVGGPRSCLEASRMSMFLDVLMVKFRHLWSTATFRLSLP